MCKVHYREQPLCQCIYVSGTVELCTRFTSLPENRNKTTFRPKLLTQHCRDLDLLFNGIDFESVDVPSSNHKVAPRGLDCRDIDFWKVLDVVEKCSLCDSQGTLQFLKVKGIEYDFGRVACASETQDGAAEEGAEAAEEGAEDAKEKAAGKSVEGSEGESMYRLKSGSSENGGVGSKASRALDMVDSKGDEAARKRARSGLAESASASMGWD